MEIPLEFMAVAIAPFIIIFIAIRLGDILK